MIETVRQIGSNRLNTALTAAIIALSAFGLGWLIVVASQDALPLFGEKSLQFVFLLVPGLFGVILLLIRADIGFGVAVILATFLISKTGMQLNIGPVRTSALEVMIVASTVLLLLRRRLFSTPPQWPTLPFGRLLLLFAAVSVPGLIVAIYRGVSHANIFWELKGYFLYPFLAFVMVGWINTERRWLFVVLVGLISASAVAITGVWTWRSLGVAVPTDPTLSATRVGGIFGVINQYGFYLSSMALLAIGLSTIGRQRPTLWLVAFLVPILLVGMAVAGSRGAWLGLGCGLIVLLLVLRPHWSAWIVIGVVLGAIWLWQFPYYSGRLLTLNDSSALDRVDYLSIAKAAFLQYPLFGGGWGAGFGLDANNNLISDPLIPWLHNDYLNVLTQVGLVGLVPFVWLWISIATSALGRLRRIEPPYLAGPIAGALAGLVALLVQASTDHIFARPDIVGQVWWMTGILFAGMYLARHAKSEVHETSSGP